MAGFRFSPDELVLLMNESCFTIYPQWLNTELSTSKITDLTELLVAKKALIKLDGDYILSPIIEYLMDRMNHAKVWLAISDLYLIYIDAEAVVSLYNASDGMVTLTPYEAPEQCFSAVQATINCDTEYVFIVDDSLENNKKIYNELKDIWEKLYEQ